MDFESNPYSPPQASIGARPTLASYEVAGKGRRFGTFVVDYFGSTFVVLALDIVIGIAIGPEGLEKQQILLFLINIIAALGYYVFFEAVWARTPGKLIFGTKVVNENGGRASFGQILGRTACRCIPFEPFSFFGDRGWHDSITKTAVVMAR